MRKTICIVFICLGLFACVMSAFRITHNYDITYHAEMLRQSRLAPSDVTPQPDAALYDAAKLYDDRVVSFIGVGDNVIHPNIYIEAGRRAVEGGRAYDFRPMYSDIAEAISSADIAFINQETLMCGEGFELSGYPRFNSPQELGHDLVDLGFDVVNIANNHMADKGSAGLKSTIDFLSSLPITLIGGYLDDADYDNVRVIERNDIKIAFLAYTFSSNGIRLYPTEEITTLPILPYLNEENIHRQCEIAKSVADAVVVSVHWGDENKFAVNSEQKKFAALFAECGVDVIVGHHPHVLQPIVWLDRPDGKRTLCIYSLGNIISTMENSFNMVGGIIGFDIVRRGGEIFIENVELVPTVFHYGKNFLGTHIYRLNDYTEALAESHGTQNYTTAEPLERLRNYVTENIDSEFLASYKGTSKKTDSRYKIYGSKYKKCENKRLNRV